MLFAILVLVCSVFIKAVLTKINYCGASMCANTDSHTFCQFSDGPGPLCTGFMPAALTKDEKISIVMRLNHRRNEAALGRLGDLPSAADMLTMRWVEDLAREAQLWANQCSSPVFPEEHDLCRDLYSIPVGQNVASVIGEAPGLRFESMVDLWYMQGRNYRGNVTTYTAPPNNNSYYGDFAQMLWAPTFMVGCARSRFMTMWKGRLRTVERLVCNMAPRGPRAARPMWTAGSPVSRCPPRSRPSPQYAGLCSMYNIQKFGDKKDKISMENTILLSTLAELEKNSSVDNVGGLDELYLTKLAAVTMERLDERSQTNRTHDLRDIFGKLGIDSEEYDNIINNRIARERRKVRKYLQKFTKPKGKLKIIGRPKPYYLYELSKDYSTKTIQNIEFIKKIATEEQITSTLLDVVNNDTGSKISLNDSKEKQQSDKGNKYSENSHDIPSEEKVTSKEEVDFKEVSSVSSDEITKDYSDNELSDEVIQDYFSNPETAREIQETLLRMEQAISTNSTDSFSSFTTPVQASSFGQSPAKVRRELRTTESEEFKKFKMELEETSNKMSLSKDEDNFKDVLLQKKGSLLQSIVNYLPNAKTFGIGTDLDSSGTCIASPSLVSLIDVVCTLLLASGSF